jgi:hypothetical protein
MFNKFHDKSKVKKMIIIVMIGFLAVQLLAAPEWIGNIIAGSTPANFGT